MDGSHFDRLVASLTTGSRRRALGGLLAGVLGLLDWQGGADVAAHDARTACKKKSGKAKRRCLKNAKAHNASHAAVCSAPCPVCQTCSNGACVPNRAADDTVCNGDGKCLNGTCNPNPECGGALTTCLTPVHCCSLSCSATFGCAFVQNGGRCGEDRDCASQNCVGYRCVEGILAVGADCHPLFPEQCASGRCGCSSQVTCTCRTATCNGARGPCNPRNATDPAVRDQDCCDGTCDDVIVATGQHVCRAL